MRLFLIVSFILLLLPQISHATSNNYRYPIHTIQTKNAPDVEGAYSQASVLDLSNGKLIFVSGQVARDPKTGKINNENIIAATKKTLDNIQAILKAAGSDLKYVVRTDVFLKDFNDWDAFNAEYAKHFTNGHYPARQTVEVGMENKIEISCIALIPNKRF